jgi:hypothetical protein
MTSSATTFMHSARLWPSGAGVVKKSITLFGEEVIPAFA